MTVFKSGLRLGHIVLRGPPLRAVCGSGSDLPFRVRPERLAVAVSALFGFGRIWTRAGGLAAIVGPGRQLLRSGAFDDSLRARCAFWHLILFV